MKRILLALFILPFIVVAQEKDFIIRGALKGLPDNTPLVIKNEEINAEPLAKAVSKDGKFELKGKIAEPNLYYLNFEGTSQRLTCFLTAVRSVLQGTKIH